MQHETRIKKPSLTQADHYNKISRVIHLDGHEGFDYAADDIAVPNDPKYVDDPTWSHMWNINHEHVKSG